MRRLELSLDTFPLRVGKALAFGIGGGLRWVDCFNATPESTQDPALILMKLVCSATLALRHF